MLSFSYFLTKKARKIRMKQGNSKLIASSKKVENFPDELWIGVKG